jgi:hypothetical protein
MYNLDLTQIRRKKGVPIGRSRLDFKQLLLPASPESAEELDLLT